MPRDKALRADVYPCHHYQHVKRNQNSAKLWDAILHKLPTFKIACVRWLKTSKGYAPQQRTSGQSIAKRNDILAAQRLNINQELQDCLIVSDIVLATQTNQAKRYESTQFFHVGHNCSLHADDSREIERSEASDTHAQTTWKMPADHN